MANGIYILWPDHIDIFNPFNLNRLDNSEAVFLSQHVAVRVPMSTVDAKQIKLSELEVSP